MEHTIMPTQEKTEANYLTKSFSRETAFALQISFQFSDH